MRSIVPSLDIVTVRVGTSPTLASTSSVRGVTSMSDTPSSMFTFVLFGGTVALTGTESKYTPGFFATSVSVSVWPNTRVKEYVPSDAVVAEPSSPPVYSTVA